MHNVVIVSFVCDNSPYTTANNITNLVEDLEDSARSLFKWFAKNQIQGNIVNNKAKERI